MNFEEKYSFYLEKVNNYIESLFKDKSCLEGKIYEAMEYSLKAGGKRLRPVLVLAAADMLSGDMDDALRISLSIECIHTYSLIHDDLPCMDNDDMRRGKPTCHKKFGEAMALLAGDGLLTFAFDNLTEFEKYKNISPQNVLKIINEIAKSSGCAGMIGGQVVDLENENNKNAGLEILNYLHARKTGALIKAALISGALSAGASEEKLNALKVYAEKIGLAFQIRDDILDIIGDEELLGKPVGSDAENKKTTYAMLLGIEKAEEEVKKLTNEALDALLIFGEDGEFLKELALFLAQRKN